MESKITIDHQVEGLARKYLAAVGGPVARFVTECLDRRDYQAIIDLKIDPLKYTDFEAFRADYLSAELLRKYPGFPVDLDRRAVAVKGFYASEAECFRTNRRLYPFVDGTCLDEGVRQFITDVRKEVESIIGSEPPEIAEFCGFGPGATFEHRGKRILLADKLSEIPTATKQLFSDISHIWIYGQTLWGRQHDLRYETVRGNRFTTVLKDSGKDRGICIEPTLNLFLQKGYGQALKRSLKRFGIDLSEGQFRNGALARRGSLYGDYATIDLSAASDTVCTAIVELLLPRKWFEALSSIRSPMTNLDGKWIKLEKFSSMGNGYTFELETLIFTAICSAVLKRTLGECVIGKHCLVYGDDMIVPTKFAREVIWALKFFGFTTNERKTFLCGGFRESCGYDYFFGERIRPFRITSGPLDERRESFNRDGTPDGPNWFFSAANAVTRAIGDRSPYNPAWRYCLSQIPLRLRGLRGPEHLGDGVIHDPNWLKTGKVVDHKHFRSKDKKHIPNTRWVRALAVAQKPLPWSHWTGEVQLATRLFLTTDCSTGHTGRGLKEVTKEVWVSVS